MFRTHVLAVCCASRTRPQKIHKCNRLIVSRHDCNCAFINLGAFFAAPVWKCRKKPGFTLVSFAQHPITGQKDTASIPCAFHRPHLFLRGKTCGFIAVVILMRPQGNLCASSGKAQRAAGSECVPKVRCVGFGDKACEAADRRSEDSERKSRVIEPRKK
jgi:hypothetical protein